MDTLEGHVLGELDSMKEELNSFQDSIAANDERIARLDEATQAMRASIDAIQEDMVVCKRALASEASIGGGVSRVDTPKPKGFDGNRDVKEVENFLWQMELYFEFSTWWRRQLSYALQVSIFPTLLCYGRRKHADMERCLY